MIRAASLALLGWVVYGQSDTVPPDTALRFEVASIKSADAGQAGRSTGVTTGHGRVTVGNETLKRCMMGAFGIGRHQIIGGPAWLDVDRFEIVAKAEQPTDDNEALMAMLQTLLTERFKLSVHRETRTVPALVLEVAKNGSKLEKAEPGSATTRNGQGLIEARVITMSRFAEVLSRQMDLPVVDSTGLQGPFNLKLEWLPQNANAMKPGTDDATDGRDSIFNALQQQLGLRLQSRKIPLEILIIDHAGKTFRELRVAARKTLTRATPGLERCLAAAEDFDHEHVDNHAHGNSSQAGDHLREPRIHEFKTQ
jgi:uncharacterized protein (TIGR03435 family)